MTPAEAHELSAEQYRAFSAYANREIRAQERALRKASK
jgi:hypothetical protein